MTGRAPRVRRRAALPAALAVVAALAAAATAGAAPSACHAPGTLTAERRGETALLVTWTPARGAARRTAHRVWRGARVVGQTRRGRIVVPVRPGRTVRIRVAAVPAAGGRPVCAATVRVRVHRAARAGLRAPGSLRVRVVAPTRLALDWGAVPRAFGYRVLRDDAVVTQTRATSLTLGVVAGSTHRLQVVAVDRSGRRGAHSRLVQVTTEITPPSAPAGLRAGAPAGGAVDVAWDAARPGALPVRGYRVLRDGAVLGQTAGTSWRVGGLREGEEHLVEVRTVDSRGRLSAPSAPLRVALDPPVPTTGRGRAYLLASTDRSFDTLRAVYTRIGRVYPTYHRCTADAGFAGRDDPRITAWAQARRIEVLARVDCQATEVVHRILTDPPVRARWLDQIVRVTREAGYQGVNLDLEAGPWSDRAAYTAFARELADRLHADGRLLSLAVSSKTSDASPRHPRSGMFDYPALGGIADEVLVMAWGYHWLTSGPGPIGPLGWIRDVARYAASMPHAERFVIGAGLYGIDWPAGGGPGNPGTALEHADLVALMARVGAAPRRDPDSGELVFAYTDAAGVRHDVRVLDAAAVAAKQGAAAAGGIPRAFVWRLGGEDPAIWSLPAWG
jgi:hypothetical protein